MSEKRKESGWPIVMGVVLLLLVLPAVYVGGYFHLSVVKKRFMFSVSAATINDPPKDYGIVRSFNSELIAQLYKPAGWIEERLSGRPVRVHGP